MLCLGIESTAHTLASALVDGKGRVLADARSAYKSAGRGIVPREVAAWHRENVERIVDESLAAGAPDVVAFAQGPGIGSCLQIGADAAHALAKRLGVPLVGVNHCVAHLEIGRLYAKARDPVFLYVSGANTQVIAFEAGKYRVFGETLDIGVGNLLDKFARFLGLGFPGGPPLYELSKKGKYFPLAYSVKGMDVCYSGLFTQAKNAVEKGAAPEDAAYSLQENAFSMLVEVSERAMAHCNKKELVLGGGVAASPLLQEKCRVMCEARNAKFLPIEPRYAVDNAVMIAWQGILEREKANNKEWRIRPSWRTDEVEVDWR
ncbi:MAG: KEOPS complex N(6)-L-threonylcarbamoyladenine synthase Kae1 [Candidatus Micrarchaeia archaeon]